MLYCMYCLYRLHTHATEYAAGNIFGALLYVGNPTNIIVAQAYDMSFLGFSKIMTLPTLGESCHH